MQMCLGFVSEIHPRGSFHHQIDFAVLSSKDFSTAPCKINSNMSLVLPVKSPFLNGPLKGL